MGLDRGNADVQCGGKLGIRPALRDAEYDIPLAAAKRGESTSGALPGAVVSRDHVDEASGYARGQDRVARGDPAYRVDDLRRRSVLEQEAAGSHSQGAQDELVGVEGGEDDHLWWVLATSQPCGRRDSVEPRHPGGHQ